MLRELYPDRDDGDEDRALIALAPRFTYA